MATGGKRPRGLNIYSLPYRARVYINNQVLIPASLVKALGISHLRYIDIVFTFGKETIELRGVRLLRTRHTDSRQFTIPKEVREKYGIGPGSEIEIIAIRRPSIEYGTEQSQ